ncbi:MAG: hypothetical protein LBS96_06730 [Oscillospiraceae bacterium]|nr:hypothetical protein [Oscillospiraceae bacterium]
MDENIGSDELELLMLEAEQAAAAAANVAAAANTTAPAEQPTEQPTPEETTQATEDPEDPEADTDLPPAQAGLRGIVAEVKEAEATNDADADAWAADAPPAKKIGWGFAVILAVVFALPALGLAIGNGYIALPALQGLYCGNQRRVVSAEAAYETAFDRAAKAEEVRLKLFNVKSVNGETAAEAPTGFSIGSFANARIALLLRKTGGPLVSAEWVNGFLEGGARVPKSMEPLVAEFQEMEAFFSEISYTLNSAYSAAMPEDEETEAPENSAVMALLLEALESSRASDEDAEKHAPYYDYYTCNILMDQPEQLKPLLAEMKKAGRESWVYEDVERYMALQEQEYATVVKLSEGRLARNAEDSEALLEQVRALWLQGKQAEAERLAAKKQTGALMQATAKVARAELLYRDGKFAEAIALCDAVIEEAQAAPESDSTRGARAGAAVTAKAIALLLQGDGADASALLKDTTQQDYAAQLGTPFFCVALAAAYQNDSEFYQSIAYLFDNSGVAIPQEIQDLIFGETTIADIFQKGWGVIA